MKPVASCDTLLCMLLLGSALAAAFDNDEATSSRQLLQRPKRIVKSNVWPSTPKKVKTLQGSDFICDGSLRYLAIPEAPYPTNFNKDSPYNLPDGITCSRPQGGNSGDGSGDRCGAQESINCLPFTNIGPINQAPVGPPDLLSLPPSNPLKFTVDASSKKLFTFMNWTVYDVGTGGAKFEVFLAGGGSQVQEHEWTPNGPQDGNSDCGACTNCEIGRGIRSFTATAPAGQGYNGWALSQKYKNVRCGASCVDYDASYWTGMQYTCVEPTCGNIDPTRPPPTQFTCSPTDLFEYNPAKATTPNPSTDACCLPRTCSQPNPGTKPGVPFNCSQFDVLPTPTTNGQKCTYDMASGSSPPVNPIITCCDCVSVPAQTGDIEVIKTVSPGRRVKKVRRKKGKKTKKTVSAAAAEPQEGVDFSVVGQAQAAVAPSKTKLIRSGTSTPQPVGSTFTYRITVTNKALPGQGGVAKGVVLTDLVPSGLTLESFTLNPFEQPGCSSFGNQLTCRWNEIAPGAVKTIDIVAKAVLAGTWENCARATTTSPDSDPDNNVDCATTIIEGACCKVTGGVTTCVDATRDRCPNTGSQTFIPDAACMDRPCGQSSGACCLRSAGTCLDNIDQSTCTQNAGQFFGGQTCAQITTAGLCPAVDNTGACCLKDRGRCVEKQKPLICAQAGGDFFEGQTCAEIASICQPDTVTGACCNTKTGSCQENIPQRLCSQSDNTWLQGGRCGEDGFCSGACCAADKTCSETVKAECSASGETWTIYGTCDTTKCDGPPDCADEWQPCDPRNPNACCDGLSCQYTWPGCKVGAYVCKPRPNNQCVSLGQPCGGASGYTCCKGLMCQWNYLTKQGTCQPANGCAGPGKGCNSDYDTCRGCRCFGGKSKWVTYKMCYKPCSHYGCYMERQNNCGAFYASAASL